ncbi:hypothetical protein L6164_037873 [Bauhinia variegata]|uniref:Uncharacterized protein n=1 Tax=Bauhinia variegata TaxID=167791 RepID=A0ACB9KLG8_BAUVA|nr:hypothetical protein L6164_037873 [Bauhinia variegata]
MVAPFAQGASSENNVGYRPFGQPTAHQIPINNLEVWLSGLRHWFAKSTYKKYHGFESHFLRHGSGTGGRNYVRERTSWWSPPEDRIALLSY